MTQGETYVHGRESPTQGTQDSEKEKKFGTFWVSESSLYFTEGKRERIRRALHEVFYFSFSITSSESIGSNEFGTPC